MLRRIVPFSRPKALGRAAGPDSATPAPAPPPLDSAPLKPSLQEEYRESDHWFFRARRRIFARVLDELVPLPAGARIVDLGPGSGVNVPVLRERGRVAVVDVARVSLEDCAEKGAHDLLLADAGRPPLAAECADLVCAFDVLEHLDDDRGALAEIRRILKPEGKLVLSVPAWRILWGRQDVLSEHRRRYHKAPLARLLTESGFEIERLSHFNCLLFPPILAVRLAMRPFLARTSEGGSDFGAPAPFGLDRLLENVFACEAGWLARRDLPIGVSLLAVAKPDPGSNPEESGG